MDKPILAFVAIAALVACAIWGRSARYLRKVELRVEQEFGGESDAMVLVRAQFRKELHTAVLYGIVGAASLAVSFASRDEADVLYAFLLVPIALAVTYGRDFIREARLFEELATLERKAEEVLTQDDLAPRQWAERLAPDDIPVVPGYEIGSVYQPGTGLLAGDFYDVHPLSEHRLAVVIGDVTGHGLEPSITAFQAKYLLRVFLRQFRDPAQALEELNATMTAQARAEEFVSLMVAVFDAEAGTVRYASAGHPTGWFWHDREVHPLRATGPLLMLDPAGTFHSRELAAEPDDVLVVYTDGLSEARAGDAIFGEDRVAQYVRRDPGVDTDVLCKSLVEAARDFASSPITDDIAVLAIRRL